VTTTSARHATEDLSAWRANASTPFQRPDWYDAAGMLDRIELVTAGRGAAVPAWIPDDRADYYHDPASLLYGTREEPFLTGAGPRLARIREIGVSGSVVTVSPYGYLGGAALAPGADADSLARALIDYGKRAGASLILSHYLFEERDGPWLAALVRMGGIPAVLGAHCHLDVGWPSLAAYHGQNRYLRGVGRQHARWREDGAQVQVYRGEDIPHPGMIAAMFAESARAHGSVDPPTGLFDRVTRGEGLDRVLLTVSGTNGRVRSAHAVLDDGTTLYPKFFATAEPGADYFGLVYGEVMALAIGTGRRHIDYGGTTHAAKLRRGCRLRYALGVFIVLDETLHGPLNYLIRLLSTEKYRHFRRISAECHTDSRPSPAPGILGPDLPGSTDECELA
jgi:hypothetical protein